jgi:pSer/pThr/pTyr-binding forkhead associated (FHA) protein
MQVSRSDRRRRRYLRWLSLLARMPVAPTVLPTPLPASGAPTLWHRFHEDCGVADGVTLRLTHRDGHGIAVPLCDPYTLVGRAAHCTVRLDDPPLAEVQAAFVWGGGRLFLVDASRSSFGPVDTLPSMNWQWGSWTAAIANGTAINDGPRKALPAHDDHPELVWEPSGPARPTRLSRRLTIIGTAAVCSVRLANPAIAPLHAALIRTDAAVWLVNLTSPNGTRVNGRPITFALVDPGDAIAFGPLTATLTHAWSASDDEAAARDAANRLAEQQARIVELEQRLARLKTMTADNPQVRQQLDAIEALAEQCERDLGEPSAVSPRATAAAAATSAASPAPVRIHSASPE